MFLARDLDELQQPVSKPLQQSQVFLEVLIETSRIDIPVQMNETVAEAHHGGHGLDVLLIEVTGTAKDQKEIALLLRPFEAVDGDHVARSVYAAFNRRLKRAFNDKL